jgi:Mn2+/Fe2+ NRAMP family transporter
MTNLNANASESPLSLLNFLIQAKNKLGPGLLLAATAVGTSHLIQSTRAGGMYSLSLAVFILFACLLKYPAFRLSTDYAAATGRTLLHSYREQGKWCVAIYFIDAIITMFVATAALSVVTAGLLKNIFSLDYSYISISVCLLATIAAVLISGKYRLLERIATFFVVLFTVFTFAAVFMIAPDFAWQSAQYIPDLSFDTTQVLFLIALIGWMPTAVGISIFQSLWVNAKSKELGRRVTMAEARFDFNFGYFLTFILAICFLFLGAGLLYNTGTEMPSSAAGFASMLITMFANAIGDWVIPLISAAAIAVMTSSLMTVLDGYPRAFQAMQKIISPNSPEDNRYYYATLFVQIVGAVLLIVFLLKSFRTFIDLSISISFLTAPFIAWLNHRAMYGDEVAEKDRPTKAMRMWSISSIVILALTSQVYIYYNFFLD